jgi:hypothetical protein
VGGVKLLDEYERAYPSCEGFIRFNDDGEVRLDGRFTSDKLRFLADLLESERPIPYTVTHAGRDALGEGGK